MTVSGPVGGEDRGRWSGLEVGWGGEGLKRKSEDRIEPLKSKRQYNETKT